MQGAIYISKITLEPDKPDREIRIVSKEVLAAITYGGLRNLTMIIEPCRN